MNHQLIIIIIIIIIIFNSFFTRGTLDPSGFTKIIIIIIIIRIIINQWPSVNQWRWPITPLLHNLRGGSTSTLHYKTSIPTNTIFQLWVRLPYINPVKQ